MTSDRFPLSPQQRRIWTSTPTEVYVAAVALPREIDRTQVRERLDAIVNRHEILRTTFERVDGLTFPLQVVHPVLPAAWDDAPVRGPLHARLDAHDTVVLSLSALCGDPGTLVQIARELAGEHDAELAQYVDVAGWLESLLGSDDAAQAARFWRERTLAARHGVARFAFETLGAPSGACTRRSISRTGTSESSLLAAWQGVLRRFTGAETIATWVTFAGRDGDALATACGPLATAVPIVAGPRLEDTLREAAEWVPYFLSDGEPLACAELRFGFEYVEAPASIELRWLPVATGELRLVCVTAGDRLQLLCAYDPGRYGTAYVEALLDTLVEAVTKAAPRQDVVQPARPPVTGVLHVLFSAQAARTPERIAVRDEHAALTFAQLDARSNQLAHRLRACGLQREEAVAIYLERSLDQVVAILGILKAGGAYVPLHTGYPVERIRYMLDETATRFVVSHSALAGARFAPRVTMLIDEPLDAPDHDPAVHCDAGQLAYILYTSGSTGRPKGVQITHASVVNLLHALRDEVYAGMPGPLTVSLNAPLVFDASVKQWIQLLDGHTLYVLPEALRIDPPGLCALFRDAKIDVLDGTPSLVAELLAEPAFAPRLVLVGGEAIDDSLWRAMVAQPATRFYNVYGPTECTVDLTAARIAGERPTIGHAIAGCTAYVLDDAMDAVPIGMVGELYAGGAGVGRGYHARPERTAERFLPDPFATAPGARMYRTGDLVWRAASGELVYIGRGDDQVKLRGHRVELGEIVAVLRRSPDVQDAIVVSRGDRADARLIAYVIPRSGIAIDRLRAHLRQHLPEYMVPAAFVSVTSWPRTTNGKLDVSALPDPAQRGTSTPVELLGNETERAIAAIWQQVLGVPKVGLHDNFFDLGGHSLRMVKVHALLRETFGREIPMVELFRHPTVAALSAYFDRQTAGRSAVRPQSSALSPERGLRRVSAARAAAKKKGKRKS